MFIPSLQNFWPRLASKYGVKKYWQSSGEESAIVNAVSAQVNAKMCAVLCASQRNAHPQY